MDFLYDGSFEGLMTCVYESYYFVMPTGIYKEDEYEINIGNNTMVVETDTVKASKVSESILSKLSEDIFIHILYTYLSESYLLGNIVLTFLRYAFMAGSKVIDHIAHEAVNPLLKTSNSVSREAHRMLGLARFIKLESGIYYCEMAPTHNIVTILAPHFKKRLSDQIWVINDAKRHIAAFYDKSKWYVNEVNFEIDMTLDRDEIEFQNLWKEYCQRIAIKERINPKLQMQMMPKKYWKYLIEME